MKKLKENLFLKIIKILLKTIMYGFMVCFLAVVLIQRIFHNEVGIFGYKLFNIISESMIPKYQTCDILLAKEVEDFSTLKVGDDVVYLGAVDTFNGKVVTHQIIDIKQDETGKYIFTTKGINNSASDPTITQDQILGKVIYKTVLLSWLSEILTKAYGFYFLIFIPLCVMIFFEIKDIVDKKKELEREEDDNEEEEKSEGEAEQCQMIEENDDSEKKEETKKENKNSEKKEETKKRK